MAKPDDRPSHIRCTHCALTYPREQVRRKGKNTGICIYCVEMKKREGEAALREYDRECYRAKV